MDGFVDAVENRLMRWMKHMTASGQDEKLMRLKDEFGMAGYGVYWSILEIIASQMSPENQQTSVTFSTKNWRKVTDFSPKKFQKFVTFATKLKLFLSEINEDEITISCPNLLKFKDEYSKKADRKTSVNSGQVSGQTPASEKETEIKKETDTTNKPKRPQIPFEEILDSYHEILPTLPRVAKLTETRKGYIKRLWLEDELPAIKNWKNFFEYVGRSDFLMGKSLPGGDRRPFKASLEWITKPANYIKILEGNYHG